MTEDEAQRSRWTFDEVVRIKMLRKMYYIALRNLWQARRDYGLILESIFFPIGTLVIVKYSFGQMEESAYSLETKEMVLGLIALQIYFQTYLMGALVLVRERVQGTMERMFTYPVKKVEILGGYLLGFSLLGIIQAIYVLIFSYFLFSEIEVVVTSGLWLLAPVTFLLVFTSIGISALISSFAKSEAQALQFIPVVVIPALLLSGIFYPVELLSPWLQKGSYFIPLTYAIASMRELLFENGDLYDIIPSLFGMGILGIVTLVVGSFTLRKTS
jgi:ABC-2 type transport system permease protein